MQTIVHRGYCAIGIWHPKHEVNAGGLWRSALAFGAAMCFTVGRRFKREASDTTSAWRYMPMMNFRDLDDLKEHLPYSCLLVAVELTEEARDLRHFCHPERACYLLGAEDHGLRKEVLEKCNLVTQIASKLCLNVATAGSIVLYDRSRTTMYLRNENQHKESRHT